MNREKFEQLFEMIAEETGMSELVRVTYHVGALQMMMLNLADFVCDKDENAEQKLTEKSQFKPFDKVLVRNEFDRWKCSFYSHCEKDKVYPHVCVSSSYQHCIPYEGNENLLGTTNEPKGSVECKPKN